MRCGDSRGSVANSYSVGDVIGERAVGGLVGQDEEEAIVGNSFRHIETSRQATLVGGTRKTTVQMKNIATFSGAGWNITAVASPDLRNPLYIWNIVNGVTYPFLSWQP